MAGLLYIFASVVGVVRLIYIPNALIVGGNAAATANNIAAHESLFRLGIVSYLLSSVLFVFVTLALANAIFWGLWLLPFGLLVYRSRFLPRFLGVWLMIGCFAYLAFSFTGLLFPGHEDKVFNIGQPLCGERWRPCSGS